MKGEMCGVGRGGVRWAPIETFETRVRVRVVVVVVVVGLRPHPQCAL